MTLTTPRTLKIFIVEDHDDTRIFLKMALQRQGYQVETATTAVDAETRIRGAGFDVLLSDIGLPDGNGWDLLKGLSEARPAVAIAMSGFGTEADIARSMSAGFRLHLVKPIKIDDLKDLLTEVAKEIGDQAA